MLDVQLLCRRGLLWSITEVILTYLKENCCSEMETMLFVVLPFVHVSLDNISAMLIANIASFPQIVQP